MTNRNVLKQRQNSHDKSCDTKSQVPLATHPVKEADPHSRIGRARRLIGTSELANLWSLPESTLRYWRSAGTGPPFVKLGGRIKYDMDDVDRYVRANKRMPSVRAHGGYEHGSLPER